MYGAIIPDDMIGIMGTSWRHNDRMSIAHKHGGRPTGQRHNKTKSRNMTQKPMTMPKTIKSVKFPLNAWL